ncbi:MAG: hypothetical protein CL912_18155 [Deltaproteobacteria bacterium]|nr:hypothetical protein [Deltaproteobacteria bacterium]
MEKRMRERREREKMVMIGGLDHANVEERPPKDIPVMRPVMERMLRRVPVMSRVRRRGRRGVVGAGYGSRGGMKRR